MAFQAFLGRWESEKNENLKEFFEAVGGPPGAHNKKSTLTIEKVNDTTVKFISEMEGGMRFEEEMVVNGEPVTKTTPRGGEVQVSTKMDGSKMVTSTKMVATGDISYTTRYIQDDGRLCVEMTGKGKTAKCWFTRS